LKTTSHEVNRLTNVQHTSLIDGIAAAALKALGKRLDLRTVWCRTAGRPECCISPSE
jgi:hypothetical protein